MRLKTMAGTWRPRRHLSRHTQRPRSSSGANLEIHGRCAWHVQGGHVLFERRGREGQPDNSFLQIKAFAIHVSCWRVVWRCSKLMSDQAAAVAAGRRVASVRRLRATGSSWGSPRTGSLFQIGPPHQPDNDHLHLHGSVGCYTMLHVFMLVDGQLV